MRVDWQKPYIEVSQGALATPMEGIQYGELLPNGTGNYCQDIKVSKLDSVVTSFGCNCLVPTLLWGWTWRRTCLVSRMAVALGSSCVWICLAAACLPAALDLPW